MGIEFIDDHPVIETRVRFRQRGVVAETEAPRVRDGDVIMWLVRARCRPPQYYPTGRDSDERYKLAIQDVEEVAPLAGALRESAIVYLDHGNDQGYIATEPTLPLDLAFGAPRATEDGVFDPNEVIELREMLAGLGEAKPGERLAETVRRFLYDAVTTVANGSAPPADEPTPDADWVDAFDRATAVLREDDDTPVPSVSLDRTRYPELDPGGSEVEVVGRVYKRRSATQDLLNQAWGDS